MSESYAIVESGGKQYRAEKGETLLVDRLPAEEGEKVTLRPVAFRSDQKVVVESRELEKVKVEAVIAGHERGPKVRIFKYKPKKGYRRRGGHRSELTRLEVTDVRMLSRKPAAKKAEPAKEKAEAKAKKPAGKGPEKPAARPRASAKGARGKGSTARKETGSRPSSTTRKSSSAKKES
jgi:large subunit ribosomal protein L21